MHGRRRWKRNEGGKEKHDMMMKRRKKKKKRTEERRKERCYDYEREELAPGKRRKERETL